MALSVLNNIPGIQGQIQLNQTNMGMQKTLFRLSSGLRITQGGDDAAGLQISDGMRAQISALSQSARNANDGISMLQVADGALDQMSKLLTRAITLAQQAQTGTIGDNQRTAINNEYTQIKSEVDRIAAATKFAGTSVFSTTSVGIAVGDTSTTGTNATISFTISTITSSALVGSGNLSTATSAATEIGKLTQAISSIASRRGTLGAYSNRLQSAASVISVQVQNLTAAESQIRDANMAEEVSNLTKYQILNQTAIAGLAQANQASQSLMALMR